MLDAMLRIRAYEEKLGSIAGPLHPGTCTAIGQEACAVGVIGSLEPRDRILTNHRSAAHLLARGASPARMMAEVLGRVDGYCRGRSGSMHISVKELGVVLTSAIAGAELGMVTGVALAQKLGYGLPGGIVAVFFGDGAACEGIFHESLNLASLWELPVLYVCENNQWQAYVHRRETMRAEHISTWAQKFDLPAVIVDGNDVEAVYFAARDAIAQIRRTGRPFFIELQTFRIRGHIEPDEPVFMDTSELQHWERRDPIATLAERLSKEGVLDRDALHALETRAAAEMDTAMLYAQASPWPSPVEVAQDVFA